MIYNDLAVPGSVVIRSDPYLKRGDNAVQLRLTYDGPLFSASRNNTRADHKHALRKCFHKQLKRFWEFHPTISKLSLQDKHYSNQYYMILPFLAEKYERNGYNFVPLVTEFFSPNCAIHILMLRPDRPGTVITSGDLDNRVKTIFDALRIPKDLQEFGSSLPPDEDEKPFYCLLEDDSLVTHVSVESDTLLQTVSDPPSESDTRLVIKVELTP